MKAKLLTVLNQCIYNKSIEDYTAIIELINSINDYNVTDINTTVNDTNIYVSMFNSDYKLISVLFTGNNKLLFCLPDDICKTYFIDNDSYNMQYDDIKALLLSK